MWYSHITISVKKMFFIFFIIIDAEKEYEKTGIACKT